MKVMNDGLVALIAVVLFIVFMALAGRYISGSMYSTLDSNYLDRSFATNIQTRT
jgi:hypothetical protein